MMNIFANMLNVATRQNDWSDSTNRKPAPAPDRRSPDEVKRERARTRHAFRNTGIL